MMMADDELSQKCLCSCFVLVTNPDKRRAGCRQRPTLKSDSFLVIRAGSLLLIDFLQFDNLEIDDLLGYFSCFNFQS